MIDLVAGVGEREAGMAAAIVELDALADAVRPAAEDDHLLAVAGLRLVGERAGEGHLVGRVEIGGRRGELGGAGVDPLEDRDGRRAAARSAATSASLVAGERGEARVGEALRLQPAERTGGLGQAELADLRSPIRRLPANCRRNHGSILQAAWISSTDHARGGAPGRRRAAGPASACRARRGWRSCRRPGRGRG